MITPPWRSPSSHAVQTIFESRADRYGTDDGDNYHICSPTSRIFFVICSYNGNIQAILPHSDVKAQQWALNTGLATLHETCVVCLAKFSPGEEVIVLECDHHFHSECASKWLIVSLTCPVCRQQQQRRMHGVKRCMVCVIDFKEW